MSPFHSQITSRDDHSHPELILVTEKDTLDPSACGKSVGVTSLTSPFEISDKTQQQPYKAQTLRAPFNNAGSTVVDMEAST